MTLPQPVPEAALHGERTRVEYGSILVPLTGTPIDDDPCANVGFQGIDARKTLVEQRDGRKLAAAPGALRSIASERLPRLSMAKLTLSAPNFGT